MVQNSAMHTDNVGCAMTDRCDRMRSPPAMFIHFESTCYIIIIIWSLYIPLHVIMLEVKKNLHHYASLAANLIPVIESKASL